MADTTTPVTPPAQDLQINLEANEQSEVITQSENAPKIETPELNLDLDLNLPEVPKNDDRLKQEDQKNTEPVIKTPAAEVVAEAPVTTAEPTLLETPVIEETTTPSTTIESEPITAEAPVELKEDMKIIDELEGHTSAGGLAPEAKVEQPVLVETPKTFDLDAMLGSPTILPPVMEAVPAPVVQADIPMPTVAASVPVMAPVFTIPTTTATVPVQAVMQTSIPQNKNKGVKVLLFTIMFVALGFTTFFILKTMYPVEFGNMFGSQTQMHASEVATGSEVATSLETPVEVVTGTEIPTTELTTGTETSSEQTGTTDSGVSTHESANADNTFGALNDLGTPIDTELPVDNVGKLTDYVTQGNNFLAQGKILNNNTMVKYGLYISKKATAFLEDIANGKEINNLSGYFAQFDQYIKQLKVLVGDMPNLDTTASEVSPILPANDIQEMTPTETTSIVQ